MSTATAPSQRERILDTALDLMAEHGASATSMRKLASACNLNVAALYHYFPSKAELLRSVIEERRWGLRMREIPPIDRDRPHHEQLVDLVLAVWEGAREEESVWRLLLGEGLRGDETALAVGHEILGVLEPALTAWLDELFGATDRTPAAVDTAAMATVLIGQLLGFLIRQLFAPPEVRDAAARREAEALARLVFASTPSS